MKILIVARVFDPETLIMFTKFIIKSGTNYSNK